MFSIRPPRVSFVSTDSGSDRGRERDWDFS